MKYYGNYKHTINPEWVDTILNTKGIEISPFNDKDPLKKTKEKNLDQTLVSNKNEEDLFTSGVYSDNLIMAEIFDKRNCPFELDMLELNEYLVGDWWIVKQMPGQFMPMHRDTVNTHDDNYRFWMPWTNYQDGHVFIHNGKFISNYSCGDLYRYEKDDDLHGSVNIGLTPRIILQISQKLIP